MSAVHLTKAQAQALGIAADASTGSGAPARARRGGGVRAGNYHTACHDCGEHFTTRAAETRHLNATRHARYQLVLEAVTCLFRWETGDDDHVHRCRLDDQHTIRHRCVCGRQHDTGHE